MPGPDEKLHTNARLNDELDLMLRKYVSPFTSIDQIQTLIDEYRAADTQRVIKEADILAAGECLIKGTDIVLSIQTIYRWKFGAHRHRFNWARRFRTGDLESHLTGALAAVREATSQDEKSIRSALRALMIIDGIAVAVASAVLGAMKPTDFVVIDWHTHTKLGVIFSQSVVDYLRYLAFCHSEAERWGLPLRVYDMALWQYGRSERPASGYRTLS